MRKLKTENKTTCRDCGLPLTKKNWPAWRARSRHRLCYECGLKRWRLSYPKMAVAIRAKRKAFRLQQKIAFVKAYGGKCACCGENKIEFLTIAHLNNDGAMHRREIGGSNQLHSWIRRNGYPKDFTVLCFNCNTADFYYGQCPHKKSSNTSVKE